MTKSIFVTLALGIVALFGATINVWNIENDASARASSGVSAGATEPRTDQKDQENTSGYGG